jgi:hypothetical protein
MNLVHLFFGAGTAAALMAYSRSRRARARSMSQHPTAQGTK